MFTRPKRKPRNDSAVDTAVRRQCRLYTYRFTPFRDALLPKGWEFSITQIRLVKYTLLYGCTRVSEGKKTLRGLYLVARGEH